MRKKKISPFLIYLLISVLGSIIYGCYGPCGDYSEFDEFREFYLSVVKEDGNSVFASDYYIQNMVIYREYGEYDFVPDVVKDTVLSFHEYFGFLNAAKINWLV